MKHSERLRQAGYKYPLKAPKRHTDPTDYTRRVELKRYHQHCRFLEARSEPEDASGFRMHIRARPDDKVKCGNTPRWLLKNRPSPNKASQLVERLFALGVQPRQLSFDHADAWNRWLEEASDGQD